MKKIKGFYFVLFKIIDVVKNGIENSFIGYEMEVKVIVFWVLVVFFFLLVLRRSDK